jgi:predicted membrane-bound spermidine synthase
VPSAELAREAAARTTARRARLLAVVFFLSGFASLVYQVVWQRLLTVHHGVGAVSITLIVCVYMFGLGLGGWLGGRLASRSTRRVALYLATEFVLGVFGVASLPLLDALGRATAGADLAVAGLAAFAFLALPTTLMGMTLPLVVQIFDDLARNFAVSVGLLYGLNTLGAAFGALAAAYGLVSFGGLDVAVWVAAAINLVLAALIAAVRRAPPAPGPDLPRLPEPATSGLGRVAFALVFATGFLAIGYEIAWVRLVGVLVKASPYAFATVLFVYLLGVALGGFAIRDRLRRGVADARSLFFLLQFALGAASLLLVLAYYHATIHTPLAAVTRLTFAQDVHPPADLFVPGGGSGLAVQLAVLLWPAFFVLVPTILMGAGFPLAAQLAYERRGSEGATVGTLYFFNLAGNVAGGALTGILVLPILGTERTLLAFGLMGLLAGLLVRRAGRPVSRLLRVAGVATTAVVATAFFPGPGDLYRAMHAPGFPPGVRYATHLAEGLDGIVVSFAAWPRLENYINGLGHGVRPPYAFFHESLEAAAHAPRAREVLVVGFGTGGIVEAMQKTDARRIVVVEINRTLLANLRQLPPLLAILEDPRTELVVDDARRYLLRSDERFDLILMDPLRTTTAYSNNLYSREFFELARSRLSPDGVVLVWTDEMQVLPRTVASVFEHVRLWSFFLLASPRPLERSPETWARLLGRFPASERRGIESVEARLVSEQVEPAARGRRAVNRDWRPVSEYYLGLPPPDASGRR